MKIINIWKRIWSDYSSKKHERNSEGYDWDGYDLNGRDKLGVPREYAGFAYFNLLDERTLVVDLHGFHQDEVKRILEDLIEHLKEPVEVLKVIHGYNHGTVIRDYIRDELDHPRIQSMKREFCNDGVTELSFKKEKV